MTTLLDRISAAPDAVIDRAIALIDARRALTGPIPTEYAATLQTPDGRWWSVRVAPGNYIDE